MTGRELIAAALRKLEVVGIGATVDSNDEAVCLEGLNTWLDAQNVDPSALSAIVRSVHDLQSGVADYTIGTGATWNRARPQDIDSASVILDPSAPTVVENPIGPPRTRAEWQGIPAKALQSSFPNRYYYDKQLTAAGYGTISVYPVPDSAVPDFVLYARVPLSELTNADLSAELVLPQGYRQALIANLAVVIAPEFGKVAPPDVLALARESWANVKKGNYKPEPMRFPRTFSGGRRFNIYTG